MFGMKVRVVVDLSFYIFWSPAVSAYGKRPFGDPLNAEYGDPFLYIDEDQALGHCHANRTLQPDLFSPMRCPY